MIIYYNLSNLFLFLSSYFEEVVYVNIAEVRTVGIEIRYSARKKKDLIP